MGADADWEPTKIEALLGPRRGRFFGSGYREVRYELASAASPAKTMDVIWSASAAYPPDWSRDPSGAPRDPHLSTIDAVVLPLRALGMTVKNEWPKLAQRRAYVSSIELRAGGTPWLDLDTIPLSICYRGPDPNDPSRNQHIFDAVTGNIRASITIVSSHQPESHGQNRRSDSECGFRGVYDGLYRSTSVDSTVTDYQATVGRLEAIHWFNANGVDKEAWNGMESGYWPAVSVIDYLVTMGQLAQALIQLRHGAGRAGTLWMRRVKIILEEAPHPLPAQIVTSMSLTRDRVIERNHQKYRDIAVDAQSSNGVRVEALLAYEEA